ncbi:hypothetical protein BH18THE2_BH18THE2_07990 [soil metagenome]
MHNRCLEITRNYEGKRRHVDSYLENSSKTKNSDLLLVNKPFRTRISFVICLHTSDQRYSKYYNQYIKGMTSSIVGANDLTSEQFCQCCIIKREN